MEDIQNLNSKKRLTELDLMRTMGFIMVVAQHILGSYAGRAETYLGPALFFHVAYLFGRPAVPMFVAITAFTLFNSNFGKKIKFKDYFGKKMINIIIPYLFWSFFYILIYNKDQLMREIIPVLIAGQGSYHLWYVGLVVRIYILFPLVMALVTYIVIKKKKLIVPMILIALAAFYFISASNNVITSSIANFVGNGTKNFYVVRFLNYSPLYYLGYFVMGSIYYFQRKNVKEWVTKYCWWMAVIYVPISIYMYILQSKKLMPASLQGIKDITVIKLLFTMMTIALIFRFSIYITYKFKSQKKLITMLGKLTFGAYLVHVLILNKIAALYLSAFEANGNLIAGLVIFVLTIVLSFIFAFIADKIPISRFIIGTVNLKKKKF